jgi:hypothetical protein
MANAIYPKWKRDLQEGDANRDLISNTVNIGLIGSLYTYDAAHEFYSEIQAITNAEIVNTVTNGDGALANVTISDLGVFDADDKTLANVTPNAGSEDITRLVLFINTGNFTTSPLVAYYDTGVSGFPLTPNGSDINVIFNASGIFQL